MASQKKGGWGSIFSGAVANLESRLDTILAEDNEASARERVAAEAAKAQKLAPASSNIPETGSREASRTRVNDRLAERLARATQGRAPSRVSTPINDAGSVRSSEEVKRSVDLARSVPEQEKATENTAVTEAATAEERDHIKIDGDEAGISAPVDMDTESVRPSSDATRDDTTSTRPSLDVPNGASTLAKSSADLQSELDQMRSEHAEAESQRQEEVQQYLERIDALQVKLTYLAKETVAVAKEANASATSESEKQLAKKDERIALLMQEGEKLSKTEMRHLQTIKKLRSKDTEHDKAVGELKKQLERAERSESDLKTRVRKAEVAERQANDKIKQLAVIDQQVEELRVDRENAAELIRSLTAQLKEAKEKTAQAERQAASKAAEVDRNKIASLENELEDAQIEKKLAEDRAATEIKRAKGEVDQERERFAVHELELKTEISGLESRLEATRAKAEEASTSTGGVAEGESSIKLLRQVETLQQQYALAKANWETIEGSLNARVATLEKERDEANRRESEMRKRARDVGTRSRKVEDDLDSALDQNKHLEHEVHAQQESLVTLQTKLGLLENVQTDSQADLDRQRKLWEAELAQRLEEERVKVRREMMGSPRSDMPPTFGRKGSGIESSHSYSRKTSGRHMAHELSALHTDPRTTSRRGSAMPTRQATPTIDHSPSLSRRESIRSLETASQHVPAAPSIELGHHPIDEFGDHSSPDRTINDLFSNSTAGPGAGPSVQLVERMSALVRKLEAEKASFRDELGRLSAQRDDARTEVVELMRELETKRGQQNDTGRLEKEREELLEMLGEREEEVAELKLDVAELKNIYRELVETKVSGQKA